MEAGTPIWVVHLNDATGTECMLPGYQYLHQDREGKGTRCMLPRYQSLHQDREVKDTQSQAKYPYDSFYPGGFGIDILCYYIQLTGPA